MTEYWTFSLSDEGGFYGHFDSREEAIQKGLIEFEKGPFYVGKARSPAPLSSGISAEDIVTTIIEYPLEEDWCLEIAQDWEPTPEQYKDLESRLKPIFDQWVKDHRLEPTWFIVDNPERIDPGAMAVEG